MFKKISILITLFTLILTITACGGASTNVKNSTIDRKKEAQKGAEKETVGSKEIKINVEESLEPQIKNAKPITDYDSNTSINQMDYVTFGLDEKSEPIEWIVLEKSNNKALLLSKYVLTTHTYNDESVDITWENSTIRKWLNSEYINTIFSKKEQGSILTTDVINNDNAKYGTKGGNNTKDKLFLLSIDEINKYFSSGNQRAATYKGGSSGLWWLRSPGNPQNDAAYVYNTGTPNEAGRRVGDDNGVRPALWVKY